MIGRPIILDSEKSLPTAAQTMPRVDASRFTRRVETEPSSADSCPTLLPPSAPQGRCWSAAVVAQGSSHVLLLCFSCGLPSFDHEHGSGSGTAGAAAGTGIYPTHTGIYTYRPQPHRNTYLPGTQPCAAVGAPLPGSGAEGPCPCPRSDRGFNRMRRPRV